MKPSITKGRYDEATIGDSFREGEVWQSPRGTLYRVNSRKARKVELQALGTGRKVKRDWDDVINWVRPREHNQDRD